MTKQTQFNRGQKVQADKIGFASIPYVHCRPLLKCHATQIPEGSSEPHPLVASDHA